jgi:hypothetical protein
MLTASQTVPIERAIRLRFPAPANLTELSIRYYLTGPFGGFGDSVPTRADVREYAIDTWRGERPAETFKAIIFCPGYRTVLLTESTLAARTGGTLSIELEPLSWVPLSGRVILGPAARPVSIEVGYLAYWSHEFFGIFDGAVQSFIVATASLGADGSFATKVPDLAHDPVVGSFAIRAGRGELRLVAREAGTGNIPYSLEAIHKAGEPVRLLIAAEYPRDLVLVSVAR